MKKTLALVLAILMLAMTLAACKKEETPPVVDDDEGYVNKDSGTGDTTGTDDGTDTGDESDTEEGDLTTGWEDKADTVYVGLDKTNLRVEPSTANTVDKIQVGFGTALARTATNGVWDKVTYGEKVYYVKSDLVTTIGNDFEFVDVEGEEEIFLQVKEDKTVNLRNTPFVPERTYDDVSIGVSGLTAEKTANNTLKKLAVSKSGTWYKVSYEGKTYYLKPVVNGTANITDPSNPNLGVGGGSNGVG